MTIDERARFIEYQLRTFEKAASRRGIDKAVQFIAAELRAAQREALEKAAEIAEYHSGPSIQLADRIRKLAGEL